MDCFASLAMTVFKLSSSGLTGRPSIPETSVIEPRGRGVLDPPPSRGMTVENVERSAHTKHSASCAGLTRASITLHENLAKVMDCRVKPGNDKLRLGHLLQRPLQHFQPVLA